METTCTGRKNIQGHPCFSGNHKQNGRMHLAVAPRCNIKCGYCNRRHDCANESRPGVTSRLLTAVEALEKVREVMANPILGPIIKVVGIAGPGDPLANEETFTTFQLIGTEFPHLMKCMSTNGLLLPEKIRDLEKLGLHSLTVTLNALDPTVGARIYRYIRYHGKRYSGTEAARILVDNQLEGIRLAAACGMTVKVNTVLIPGLNGDQVTCIARRVRDLGAAVMNVMPVIPQAEFSGITPPTQEELSAVQTANEQIISQFRHCRQCRADAVGLVDAEKPIAGKKCVATA